MKKMMAAATVVLFAGAAHVHAAEGLDTDAKRFSYFVGMQVAQQLKGEGVSVDEPSFLMGFRDLNSGAKPKLTQEEIQATLARVQQQRAADLKKLGEANKSAGEKFLAANARKSGVKKTSSGLQYKVLKEGKGRSPKPSDIVEVNYRGTLLNGTEFDSSAKHGKPAVFPLNRVIQGWQEALPMMKEGGKWQIYVPSQLAYGESGTRDGKIGPNATLIFDIELLDIKDQNQKK